MVDKTRQTINAESVKVDFRRDEVSFAVLGATASNTISFDKLDKIVFDGKILKIFKPKKKATGYYLITENNGLSLATFSKKITSNTGGFNVTYIKHEVVVFKGDEAIENISFTENNDKKNIKKRLQTIVMIKRHFPDCPKLITGIESYLDTDSQLHEGGIVAFLNREEYIFCK